MLPTNLPAAADAQLTEQKAIPSREQPKSNPHSSQGKVCVINALWLLINMDPPRPSLCPAWPSHVYFAQCLWPGFPCMQSSIVVLLLFLFVCNSSRRQGTRIHGHGLHLGPVQNWLICVCARVYKVCNFIQIIILRVSSVCLPWKLLVLQLW